MFDKAQVEDHQKFIVSQTARKELLGKNDYSARKLHEEIHELNTEGANYRRGEKVTKEYIQEFGDVLFCLLGSPEYAAALSKRMEFNRFRAEVYKHIDLAIVADSYLAGELSHVKLTEEGWVFGNHPIRESTIAVLVAAINNVRGD